MALPELKIQCSLEALASDSIALFREVEFVAITVLMPCDMRDAQGVCMQMNKYYEIFAAVYGGLSCFHIKDFV